MKKTVKNILTSLIAASALSIIFATGAHAATFTVTNTDDTGAGSLRQAIIDANNAAGADVIEFDIPGSGVRTIKPQTELPIITEQLAINGYSQQGAQPNSNLVGTPFNGTILIELDGTELNGSDLGLRIDGADGSSISGLSIGGFPAGIVIGNASDVVISGNLIGLRPDGTPAGNEEAGLAGVDVTNMIVGGSTALARNVISYNSGVSGNISIGLGGTGSENNRIQGNYIGTAITGQVDQNSTTGGIGITLNGSFNTLIGGTTAQLGNIIAGNYGAGIIMAEISIPIADLTIPVLNNPILGNSIYNTSPGTIFGATVPGLGIDLLKVELDNTGQVPENFFDLGPNPNDPGDADEGPNHMMNFPVITSVSKEGGDAVITFDLDAADSPSNQYRVEFFANDAADATGYGEGQTYLGFATVSNGTNQEATIALPQGFDLEGQYISATTTAVNDTLPYGFGSTSEFSQVLQFVEAGAEGGEGSGTVAPTPGSLADTGRNVLTIVAVALAVIATSMFLGIRHLRAGKN